MKDMARTPEENKDIAVMDAPIYPYGLGICLEQEDLDHLDVDYSDWKAGDVFPLDIMVKLTSVSERETEGGKRCRVEMQITHIGAEEENEEEERPKRRSLY